MEKNNNLMKKKQYFIIGQQNPLEMTLDDSINSTIMTIQNNTMQAINETHNT